MKGFLQASILVISLASMALGSTANDAKEVVGAADVEEILKAMEVAGENVQTIRCRVRYTVEDRLNIITKTKHGSILFKRSKPHPMFLVEFTRTDVDDSVHRDREWWLLKDRWLIEAKAKSKTIIRREIVEQSGSGEEADLFDLEKSRIPIPFGQSRDQIVKNFEVTLVPAQMGDPDDCDHLLCRPRADVPLAKEVKRLEYYVSKKHRLPLKIVVEDAGGGKVTIGEFEGITGEAINAEVGDSEFRLPDETRGFHVDEEPLAEEPSAGLKGS